MQSQIKQGHGSALKRSIPSWLWGVSVFSLIFLILFLNLGNWQMDRAAEKQELLAEMEQRRQAPPLAVSELPSQWSNLSALEYRKVRLRGRFDPAQVVMVDNQVRGGRAGVDVIGVFRVPGIQQPFLVNRGWLPFESGLRELPRVDSLPGELQLEAEVYQPSAPPLRLVAEQENASGFPLLVQHVDVESLQTRIGLDFAPTVLRLVAGSPAALRAEWPGVMVSPQKHMGYAVQWFAMSLALLALTAWCWKSWWSQERE